MKKLLAPLPFIILFCLFITLLYYLLWYPNAYFCEKYFPDTPTHICVLSGKYKYDND